jgi:hypothetical protein
LANPQVATIPGARANKNVLPPRTFQSEASSYGHQVTVALPASYAAQPERACPVLWVLDSPLIVRLVVGMLDVLVLGNLAPKMVVVGIVESATAHPSRHRSSAQAAGSVP